MSGVVNDGPPHIDRIRPEGAAPGTAVAISGSGFGARSEASSVIFRVADLPEVRAAVAAWSDAEVGATVPAVTELGAAGRATVTVANPVGQDSAGFTVLDVAPPRVAALSRSVGVPGDEVTISGEHFGVDGTQGLAVTLNGGEAPVVSWSAGSVRIRVPQTAEVGGPGEKELVVHTPWGESAGVPFEVVEKPTITDLVPDPAPPDSLLTIRGYGFAGFVPGQSRVVLTSTEGQTVTTALAVVRWTETEILGIVPGLTLLKTTGEKEVRVSTALSTSEPASLIVSRVGSVTGWTRLEPRARTEDLEAGLATGLRAEIADPLWLIGRQWALGELRGEDAGSPISARLLGESAPLSRWRPRGATGAADLEPGVPLEAIVERERLFPPRGDGRFADRRLAAEAGLQFLRHIADNVDDRGQADVYRKRFVEEYGLAPPTQEEKRDLDPESLRFLSVAADRVPDGARLYAELRVGELPEKPPVRGRDRDAMLAAIADWFAWCDALANASPEQPAWDRERMEYSFSVSALTSAGEVVLEAPEYSEGRLDWHVFINGGGSLGPTRASSKRIDASVIPSPVSYPGMPAPRWWEMEDGRVNFSALDAGPPDLLRLLFLEFATAFGNDWFTIPVDGMQLGSLTRLSSLVVTDTFGEPIEVEPFTGEGWRMFHLTGEDAEGTLLLPPVVVGAGEAPPLEEVVLLRDEMANLGWAVERTVASATGRPLRRHEAYQEARRRAQEPVAQEEAGGLEYRLMTGVPEFWIPLVPRPYGGSLRLAREAMPREDGDGLILPRGHILGRESLLIHDEEVPRDGANVTRAWQLARDPNGQTHLWLGRRKGPGRGEGSSGLGFDVVEEP